MIGLNSLYIQQKTTEDQILDNYINKEVKLVLNGYSNSKYCLQTEGPGSSPGIKRNLNVV